MDYVKSAISKIYGADDDFIVIGLTGRTGSGCSTAGKILASEANEISHSLHRNSDGGLDNLKRKKLVIYKHFEKKWQKFSLVQAGSLLTYALSKCERELVRRLLDDNSLGSHFNSVEKVLNEINKQKENFDKKIITARNFYCEIIVEQSDILKKSIGNAAFVVLHQQLGRNFRSSGCPATSEQKEGAFFGLAEMINNCIKDIREEDKSKEKNNGKEGGRTYIVVDAIRNPLEALFFQEKYASFYLMAISCDDQSRKNRLARIGYRPEDIEHIDGQENKDKDINEDDAYVLQDIQACLQRADIYVSNPERPDEVSAPTALANQIVTFVSLMQKPGLITPSNLERCMQIAHTAKLNSGCISRQVGAAITDSNYSVRAIGWNDVPAGQVPCNLRSLTELANGSDLAPYSGYERKDKKFVERVKEFSVKFREIESGGRMSSFCFKSHYNELTGKNNQVHTRSLHAEENAFLQISKYGGIGIQGGNLFTTASPCELCAKKAYQLGVKKIIYIDPYPGIAMEHILDCGESSPEMILFSGAIGSAFHRLYTPKLPYKDELNALLAD